MSLTKENCYGLLNISLCMMEKQHKEKKVIFRNAIALIFVLLKFRLQDNNHNFLTIEDSFYKKNDIRKIINRYIDEIKIDKNNDMPKIRSENLKESKNFLEYVKEYIECKGDPNRLPLITEENSEEDSDIDD